MSGARGRLRILYLIDFASATGGAERFALGLARNLPRDRFEPWICSTRESEPVIERQLAAEGIPHVNLGRRAKWDVHRLGKLVPLLRRERFDILHTHKFGSNIWGTLIGASCRVPIIVAHEHSWAYEGEPVRAWLDGKVIARLATRFVAVSSADGRRMVSHEGVPAEKVIVIPTGYVPSPVTSNGDLRAELSLSSDTPVIAIAAVLRPEKRFDLLLEAHARVLEQLPDARLVIAGDGECRSELERGARGLGIEARVHLLGSRADVDGILRAADVGVLCSDREGSPLLAFECMATGTPLVATEVGGLPDIVEQGRTGILVPRRDPEALAQALVALLTDRDRRVQMGQAARAKLAQFTIQSTATRFAELYETLERDRQT